MLHSDTFIYIDKYWSCSWYNWNYFHGGSWKGRCNFWNIRIIEIERRKVPEERDAPAYSASRLVLHSCWGHGNTADTRVNSRTEVILLSFFTRFFPPISAETLRPPTYIKCPIFNLNKANALYGNCVIWTQTKDYWKGCECAQYSVGKTIPCSRLIHFSDEQTPSGPGQILLNTW